MSKQFNFTFNSIKKNISFNLSEENYTKEIVKKLLSRICIAIDQLIYKELNSGDK